MQEKKIILFFDGVCNLCSGWVDFIIKFDTKNNIKFCALQSDVAKQILLKNSIDKSEMHTVILLVNDVVYTKSTAAIKLLNELGGAWKLFNVFLLIPKFIRDFFYSIIAKNRYRFFGKRTSCYMPSDKDISKFIAKII